VIRSIDIENARIFEGEGWSFPLSPLTVLCGTNSAGKSTLLKVLLLLKQSLGITDALGPTKSRLRFSGSQIDLGDYSSFISHRQTYRDLLIGVSLDWMMPVSLANQLRESEGQLQLEPDEEQEEEWEQYELSAKLKFGFMYPHGQQPEESAKDRAAEDVDEGTDPTRQPLLKHAAFRIRSHNRELLSWEVSVTTVGEKGERGFQIRLPRKYFAGPSGLASMEVPESGDYVEIPTFLRGLLPDRLLGRVKFTTPDSPEDPFRVWPLPQHIERAQRDLRRAISNIQYLGPLRSPAKRFYTSQMDADPIMDPSGEFLPDLLRERAESRVVYMRPGESQTRRETLAEALNFWLFYLRTGHREADECEYQRELSLQTIQDVLIQLAVRTVTGQESHALADSGFGYSQVLPILARGLMTTVGAP
jgi:hypothetical protein